jgi:ABC-2 type transport system permease protein
MNTQSNAMPDSLGESQINGSRVTTPEIISPAQLIWWSVQRELWENRSIYVAPLAAGVAVLVGFLISMYSLPAKMRGLAALSPMQQHELIERPYDLAAMIIMAAGLLVAILYCLDALHGERRDRSILFWKSLPVSDFITVLSKASIPIVVIPLIGFAVTVATQLIMFLLSTAVLHDSGVSALRSHLSLFQMSLMLFYHLLALHGIWFAPVYAWLLLVSGWARRAVLLWAVLPVAAIAVVEKLAFNTWHFAAMLEYRAGGGPESNAFTDSGGIMMHPLSLTTLREFLTSPGLWSGIVLTGALLAVAVRSRRYQGPI